MPPRYATDKEKSVKWEREVAIGDKLKEWRDIKNDDGKRETLYNNPLIYRRWIERSWWLFSCYVCNSLRVVTLSSHPLVARWMPLLPPVLLQHDSGAAWWELMARAASKLILLPVINVLLGGVERELLIFMLFFMDNELNLEYSSPV